MRYVRAVRWGDEIEVSGTTAVSAGGVVLGGGDPGEQTRACLRIIEQALVELGASKYDLIRTRIFLTDIESWRQVAQVHDEILGDVGVVSSVVGIERLVHPDLLVEIEAKAIIGSGDGTGLDRRTS